MKPYPQARIRNVAVIGHGGTGKTSLVEAALFATKAIDRLGRVDEGTATTDFDPEEVRRKHTVNLALAPLEWADHKINIVDAPGYPDFIGEVVCALRVAEAAIVVVDGVAGVQVQAEKGWAMAAEAGLARMVVINRLDRENSSFTRILESLQGRLPGHMVPVQIPIGAEGNFRGVVDLLSMKAFGQDGNPGEIPMEVAEDARAWRDRLVEAAAECDDALVEKYLEGTDLTPQEVVEGLRKGVQAGQVAPVLCASAVKGIGVAPLLDTIVSLVPAPDVAAPKGKHARTGEAMTLKSSPDGPLAALVFKTMADPYVGKLSYFRVYSGTLPADSQVYNASKDKMERVGTVFHLRGKHQEPTNQVVAGDIGAVAKLAETETGHTLCAKDHPVLLDPINFPRPIIAMAVEPKSKGDEDKMGQALHRLTEEDPTFHVHRDTEMKQTVASGMGEAHLEIMMERLKRKFGVDVTLTLTRVPYREAIRGTAKDQGRYVRQSGGRGQYGVCFLEVAPLPRGSGLEFVDKIVGASIPNQFIPSVEKGVKRASEEGVLAGYPIVGVRVTLFDGKHHPVDSSDIAFQIAGSMGFKEAVQQAGLALLE
ncbi:MAG: elongation factor G, partial [Armatimonadetes bacterium]|nr:elongation factor G [Armatimonadota bacterium]